jgi:hypothetical protein
MDPLTIAAIATGVVNVINGLNRMRAAARTAGTLTPAQDLQVDEYLEASFRQDHWRASTPPLPLVLTPAPVNTAGR